MQYYLLKRRYAGSYYTSRIGETNKPAVLAFLTYEKAKYMKGVITSIEYQPQDIVIEKTNKAFVDKIVQDSLLPVIVFRNDGDYLEIETNVDDVQVNDSRRVLENMFLF